MTRADSGDFLRGVAGSDFGEPARLSRALFVSRGPSGLGDAGKAQPVRAGEQVSFGMPVRRCGLVREAGARRAPRWSGHIGPAALRGGRAGWPTPSRSPVEAALDGGFGDSVAALRGSWLECRF